MREFVESIINKGFRIHVLLAGVLCSVSLILVTVFGMFVITRNTSRILAGELLSKLVWQISLNIDENISQIQSLLINITVDQKVLSILDESGRRDGDITLSQQVALQDKLMQTHLLCNDIQGLYLFDSRGNAYYNSISPSLRLGYQIREEDWYGELGDARSIYVLPTHVPERYAIKKPQVISIVRQMENLETREPLTTIVVDVKLEMLDHIMDSLQLFSNYSLLILDEKNQLVYSNEGTDIGGTRIEVLYQHILEEGLSQGEAQGSARLDMDGEWLYVEYATSEKTGWKIFCGADVEKITNVSRNIRAITIGLIIATGIITAFSLGLCMIHPFQTLNQLEKEQEQQLLHAARLELKALQAQINPHFIYNALETISMMAEADDEEDIQQMAIALGKLLRISMKGKSVITLKEELEHVGSYLLIHRKRFGENFRIHIQVDEALWACMVPKLILQPLIENSIRHGLKKQIQRGEIRILGYTCGEHMVLEVFDNGAGMDKETLEKIRAALESRQEDAGGESGIGLCNVSQRIRLCYPGGDYGLRIESCKNLGTTVYVTLPRESGQADACGEHAER